MNGRIDSLFCAVVLAFSWSSRSVAAQAAMERCDLAMVAAEEMVKKVAECSAALPAGGPGASAPEELQLLERLRSYNNVGVYMAGTANPCAKLASPEVPKVVAQCSAYFTGLQGHAAACKKLPPVYAGLCRDAAAYAAASKAADAARCGPSGRCRVLMGQLNPAAPKTAANFPGFVCQQPLQSVENRKVVTATFNRVQFCLTDIEVVMPLAEPSVVHALDARAEKLARLRLSLNAYFSGER